MRGNGERIGPQNLPTSSIAGGIWNLLNQQRAQQRGAWPSATPAVVTDPYFMYVPLLLNTTSTNAQQNNTFLDSSTNNFTITRNGTPTQGSFTPYQPSGYWSGYFSGTGDYLTAPSNSAFAFGTNDFTIECWVYLNASKAQAIVDTRSSGPSANGIAVAIDSSNFPYIYVNGTTLFTSSTALSNNVWNHLAVVKSSNVITLYINGVKPSTGSGTSTTNLTDTSLTIAGIIDARDATATYKLNGYASNVRLVKGVAVYTGAFTPPTTPLAATQSAGTNISAITGTQCSLLTCSSNRFIDIGGQVTPNVITVNGTPKVQAFQPFSPAASYSAATYGGSGYFNGGGDYLQIANSSALQIGGGAFTIEAFVYPTSSGNYRTIISKRSGGTAEWELTLNNADNTLLFYTSTVYQTSNQLTLNSWNHVAASSDGTTLKLFINGVQGFSNTVTVTNSTNVTRIGAVSPSSLDFQYFPGYISNLRVVKGTAVYTVNFTPPTVPVTAITNTSLLTNFTNAGIYDAAWQNNALTVGDAQASTTQYKWSPTSMKYDGTGDWLTAIDSPGLQLGSGDFTIEGWFYLSATGAIYGIVSKGTATTGWSVNVTVLNKLQFSYTASNLTGATSLSASTWYYFAVVRSGTATGNLKVYLNGTADATSGGAVTDNFNQTSTLYIGADRIGTSPLNGYVQDLRITKGVARTITTPTAAFPTR